MVISCDLKLYFVEVEVPFKDWAVVIKLLILPGCLKHLDLISFAKKKKKNPGVKCPI